MNVSLILHPVQYSEGGRYVAAQALALAEAYHSELHVLHVRSRRHSRDQEAAEQLRLRNFVTKGDDTQVRLRVVILYGDPVTAVAEYAQSTNPDLVIVGNTGRRGSTLWRPGVYARELASVVNCPTLMVPANKQHLPVDANFSFRNILGATDFSEAALAAVREALTLAVWTGGRITLLHVLEGYPHDTVDPGSRASRLMGEYPDVVSAVSRELRQAIPSDAGSWCDVQTRVDIGVPYRAILSTASDINADLIVMGLPVRGRFDAVLMSSTTAVVARRASCPVLMLPGLPTRATEIGTADDKESLYSHRSLSLDPADEIALKH